MNTHLTEPLIERYREQALPPAELLDADDHLAGCEVCRQRLNDEQRVQAAGGSLRRDLAATELTHIPYEQLVSYVEGDLDETDREIVDSHLKLCEQCSAELDGLRAFATEVAAYPAKEYAPQTPSSLGDKVLRGIYKLDGDKLMICYAYDPDLPRPTEFKTKAGERGYLYVLERVKK